MAVGVEKSQAQVSIRSSGPITAKLLAGIDLRPYARGSPRFSRRSRSIRRRIFRETCPEHGSLAFRLLFGRFILNHVPMLDKDSVFNAENVCCNPVHRQAEV